MSGKAMTNGRPLTNGAIQTLRERMRGPVLTPEDGEYAAARQIWNAMIDRRPGVIARCPAVPVSNALFRRRWLAADVRDRPVLSVPFAAPSPRA